MKIKLLNNGGYYGLEEVQFPAVVDGYKDLEEFGGDIVLVPLRELKRVGADIGCFLLSGAYPFAIGIECEVIQ